MKTRLNIDLADVLKRKCPHGFHAPADIDIDTFLEFADDDWGHELDVDVHELLAERQAIALIWDADMLLSTYPHLTADQAWEVLRECERGYSAENGLTWADVADVVNDRFPDAPEAKQRVLDRLNTLRRQIEALPAEGRTSPAAYAKLGARIDAPGSGRREGGVNVQATVNPFYAARASRPRRLANDANVGRDTERAVYARLPQAPVTASPVPHLTSLYHNPEPGPYGDRRYPGNCSGNLIKDLLRFYRAFAVYDPMTGSGTCKDVCKELSLYCWSGDIHQGFDACEPPPFSEAFDFCWLHPPYWRQKLYADDPRDLSRCPTLRDFLGRYALLIERSAGVIRPGGKMAVLMGDYSDREAGFVPLVFYTKLLAFRAGLRQCATDIIRFSHGASSGRKVYRSSFIPGLHDVCMVFEKTN